MTKPTLQHDPQRSVLFARKKLGWFQKAQMTLWRVKQKPPEGLDVEHNINLKNKM